MDKSYRSPAGVESRKKSGGVNDRSQAVMHNMSGSPVAAVRCLLDDTVVFGVCGESWYSIGVNSVADSKDIIWEPAWPGRQKLEK